MFCDLKTRRFKVYLSFIFFVFVFVMILAGCSFKVMIPSGQNDKNIQAFYMAMGRSCARISTLPPDNNFGPGAEWGLNKDWQDICQKFPNTYADIEDWLRVYFKVYKFTSETLITGYYEPLLYGSYKKSEIYKVPLLKPPIEYHDEGWIGPSRAEIIATKPKNEDVLLWVKDEIEAFFLQIQGSGRVQLDTGETIHIGYGGKNHHPYTSIGRILVKQRVMELKDISMQSIKNWMRANPDLAHTLMLENASYIYFRRRNEEGPLGYEEVPLTAGGSAALDKNLYPMGIPIMLEGDRWHEYRVCQDTGSAIQGVARIDLFQGFGKQAEQSAGSLRDIGGLTTFIPKKITLKQGQ